MFEESAVYLFEGKEGKPVTQVHFWIEKPTMNELKEVFALLGTKLTNNYAAQLAINGNILIDGKRYWMVHCTPVGQLIE